MEHLRSQKRLFLLAAAQRKCHQRGAGVLKKCNCSRVDSPGESLSELSE